MSTLKHWDRIIELLEERDEAVRKVFRDYITGDLAHWNALTYFPEEDKIIHRCEASPCYGESEYYGKPNCPITFWSIQANYGQGLPVEEDDIEYEDFLESGIETLFENLIERIQYDCRFMDREEASQS